MSYRQLRVPNLDPVVYLNGKILYDWMGWCLAVAQTMFGSQRTSPSAWSEWVNVVKYKHQDRNIPGGVYVPIWFDGYWNGQRVGHVAVYKDGKVWSSPYTHKPYADVLGSIADVERIYGMRYVGWSEDIGNTRVVEWVNNNATVDQVKDLYREILEREADQGGIDHYAGKQPYDFVRNDLLQSQERKDLLARKEQERQAADEAARKAEEARIAAEKAAADEKARLEAEAKAAEEEAARLAEEERKKKEEQAANAPSWGDLIEEQKKTNSLLTTIINFIKRIFNVK